MKAEDTVMSTGEIELRLGYLADGFSDDAAEIRKVLKAQAENAFKAGEEEGYFRGFANGERQGKQEGIREVVEWIEKHQPYMAFHCKQEWQAQLKEWFNKAED